MITINNTIIEDNKESNNLSKLIIKFSKNASAKRQKQAEFYLETPGCDETSNPLVWWKNHEKKIPDLAKIAKSLLTEMISSASVERNFSLGGIIINKIEKSFESFYRRIFKVFKKEWILKINFYKF